MHGKRIQESTGATNKTLAREYEKRRRAELERAAVGLPSERNCDRIRSVSEVIASYLQGYELTHRPTSYTFARNRLAQISQSLGTTLLSDLTEARVHDYIR